VTIRLDSFEPVNWLVGMRFPEADEDGLWRCADAWWAAAEELRRLRPEAVAAGERVLEVLGGEPGATFDQFWRRFSADGEGFIDQVAQACEQLAAACDGTAREVEYAKIQYILALVVLAATLAYLTALVWAGGISAVGVPLAIAVAQFTIRTVLMRLVSAVAFGAAFGAVLDGVAQGIQIGLDHRDGWDWAKTRRAAEDGAIYGAATGGVFLAGGRFAPHVTGSLPGAVGGVMVAGGLGGLAAPLAHGEAPTEGDFLMSTTSAAVGAFGRRPGPGAVPDLGHLAALDTGPLTAPDMGSLVSLDPSAALPPPSLDLDASTGVAPAADPPPSVDRPMPASRIEPVDASALGPRVEPADPPGPRVSPEADVGATLAGDPHPAGSAAHTGTPAGQPAAADPPARVADSGARPHPDAFAPSRTDAPPTRTELGIPAPGAVSGPGVVASQGAVTGPGGPGVPAGATGTTTAGAPMAGAPTTGVHTAGAPTGAAPGVQGPPGHPAPSLSQAAGPAATSPPIAAGETGSTPVHAGPVVAGGLAGVGGAPPASSGADAPSSSAAGADTRPYDNRVSDEAAGDANVVGRLSLDEAVDVVRTNLLSTSAGLAFYAPGDQIRSFAQAIHPTDGFMTLDLHGSTDGFRIDNIKLSPEQFAAALRRLEVDGVISLGDGVGIKLLSCDTAAGGNDSVAARLARALGVEVIAPDEAVWTTLAGDEIVASAVLQNGTWVPTHPPDGAWHHFDPRGNDTLLDNLPVADQTDAETRSRSHSETAQPRAPDDDGGTGHAIAEDGLALDEVDWTDPRTFDPAVLRGASTADIDAAVPDSWERIPSTSGSGMVYRDPNHPGRMVRVMPGYPEGNRPDGLTHGPYAVVSQNGGRVKVPLAGNPTLAEGMK